jgi:hypothetical protein
VALSRAGCKSPIFMLGANFGESPKGEVRRIPLLRTPVNKGKRKGRVFLAPTPHLSSL